MPADIPPWIRAAQPAPLYARGLALGLQAAEQQAQQAYRQQALQQEAEQTALRQQLAREEMALEQERYRQQLELGRAEESRKAELAGRQYAAQQEYQRRVTGGEDAMKVLSEMWPALGGAGPEAALIRSQQAQQKKLSEGPIQGQPILGPDGKPIPGLVATPSATGTGWTVHTLRPETPPMSEFQRSVLIDRMQKQADALVEKNPDLALTEADPAWNARRKSAWASGRKSVSAIEGRIDALASGEPSLPSPGAPQAGAEGPARWRYNPATGKLERIGGAPLARPEVPAGALPTDMPPAPMIPSINPTNWMNPPRISGGRY